MMDAISPRVMEPFGLIRPSVPTMTPVLPQRLMEDSPQCPPTSEKRAAPAPGTADDISMAAARVLQTSCFFFNGTPSLSHSICSIRKRGVGICCPNKFYYRHIFPKKQDLLGKLKKLLEICNIPATFPFPLSRRKNRVQREVPLHPVQNSFSARAAHAAPGATAGPCPAPAPMRRAPKGPAPLESLSRLRAGRGMFRRSVPRSRVYQPKMLPKPGKEL